MQSFCKKFVAFATYFETISWTWSHFLSERGSGRDTFCCFVTGGHSFCRIPWIEDAFVSRAYTVGRPPSRHHPKPAGFPALAIIKAQPPTRTFRRRISSHTAAHSSRTCGTNLCDPCFVFRCGDIIVLFKPSRHPLTHNVVHHLVLEGRLKLSHALCSRSHNFRLRKKLRGFWCVCRHKMPCCSQTIAKCGPRLSSFMQPSQSQYMIRETL